jgi:SNF2 family DNA or RNA helicase
LDAKIAPQGVVIAREFADIGIPIRLRTPLMPHQEEGVTWLQTAWAAGCPGVLLADDMGLGKTLQTLTFLTWLREGMDSSRPKRAPILIVAPTGLLKNWEQEHNLHLHAPGIGEVVKAFGPGLAAIRRRKGREIELGQAMLDSNRLVHADWILTTYETLRDYQHSFCAIRYAAVVFDEMQKVKTPGKMMTDAAQALNADFFVGMTGTPIENRLADLWCLVETVQPGLLDSLASFSKKYERDENPDELRALKATLTEPSAELPQIMMRRMKADRLKGLPEKIEHPLEQIMSAVQARAYDDAVQLARSEGGGSKVLDALHRLRSISLHPLHPSTATDDSYVEASARFKLALGVLDAIAVKDEKALVFLESREMQPYFASLLHRRYKLKELPMLVNGTVAGPKRQERVNKFQTSGAGFDVIILSPRAGGVGITLTAANHVIHLSRWWNPAVEDQCTDRVYRIGQTREVHVYYPQALHPVYADQSFDRRLHALLERKRKLSRDMLMPPMSPDDAKDLFEQTVGTEGGSRFDLGSIDAMEPVQFEDWVLGRLKDVGHKVNRTPKSHDRGADGVAYHRISGRPYIVQCKHTQRTTSPDQAIGDLLRAQASYGLRDPGLVAVTNATGFGRSATATAKSSGIRLISRTELERWPFMLD